MNEETDDMNLYALIDEVAANSAATDPHVIAKEVADLIPAKDRVEALRLALAQLVRTQTGLRSLSAPTSRPDATKVAEPGRSRKFDAYARLQKILGARVAVGDGEHKFLGDMTQADLDVAATIREDLAAANVRNATKLRGLAKRLKQMHLTTVRELPESELFEVWS